jgi:hypothetical protein
MLWMEGPRERLRYGIPIVQGLLHHASMVLNILQFRTTHEELTF